MRSKKMMRAAKSAEGTTASTPFITKHSAQAVAHREASIAARVAFFKLYDGA